MSKANVQLARSKIGQVYAKGCTGFVAEALGRPQKHSSEWTYGQVVNNPSAGDVLGWPPAGPGQSGHVVIYDGSVYLNCPGPGKAVKENNSMGRPLRRVTY